jgi:Fe-S oxidoreductase
MERLHSLETVVFVPLLVAALYGFGRRFGRVIALIRRARPDADFTLQPIGKRVRDFVWEVLLQSKVIRERPLPGLAHAFVFWGFCAFALVTLNHFAIGLGFPLFSLHDGVFGPAYGLLAACFAFAVSASILGLAFRRMVLRPRWLGPVSYESGFIALLILILMLTYLADYVFQPEGAGFHILWWAHTSALLIFLPLIPHTKHMHLVLSPVTIFLSRGCFSAIPQLVGDEDLGLVASKDITKLGVLQAFSCVECGRCTEHCPANNTGKILNPKEVILGIRNHVNEFGVNGDEMFLAKHVSEEAVFQCTTCGACEYQCPVGIEHLPFMIGLRRGPVNTGTWENEHGGKLFRNLEKNGNAMGFAPSERDKFINKIGLPIYDGSQEYLLWLGCMGSYDPGGWEIIRSLVTVMRHHGITFGVLKKEKCTGDPARRLGNDLLFQTLSESNRKALGKASKVLSICPHCVRTMSEDYKETGGAVPVEHHSSLLARLAASGSDGKRVVYHDPCYLGRYQGIYEEPRKAAAQAGRLVEAPRHGDRSFCCGAGGGLAFLGEEKGERVNHARAKELAATGADIVAAACPFCNTMFRDGLAAVEGKQPQLLDIAQIAAARLEK